MDENGMGNIIGSLIRNNADGFGNCNGIWVIFLLLLCFNGGFGGGWANRGNFATTQDVAAGFANQTLNADVRANGAAINQLGIQSMGQANNIAQSIALMGDQVQAGFCNTNHNIDNLKYELAQQTTAITGNATANTQHILDKLCAMESAAKDARIQQLSSDLQAAQLTLANAAQTQNIVSALRTPNPVPAYLVNQPCPALTAGTTIV